MGAHSPGFEAASLLPGRVQRRCLQQQLSRIHQAEAPTVAASGAPVEFLSSAPKHHLFF